MFDSVASQVPAFSFVDIFNFCVFLTFTICYTYQLYYVLVVLTRRAPKKVASKDHRYAVMVAARNEETVIADSTPFYILDEVGAALDDTNLRRLAVYINTLREDTQLIMNTHQRRTMEMADVLFGVSMQGDGVTKVISQKLDQALKHAE